ncbi:MAG: hypothetical protein HND27_04510 [Bacteroidetes bacterium]|nr:hypothetical protein [Flavobacteriales bacterium]NOG95020.1 hypothetical protein [Bacteroidota bacterium]CAG0989148.1 hypothetical protein FLAV_02204 [Flavobacteriales bacterium]
MQKKVHTTILLFLLCCFMLVCTITIVAQSKENKEKSSFTIGISFSPEFATTRAFDYSLSSTDYNYSPLIYFGKGISFLNNIKTDIILLETEILFINRGFKETIKATHLAEQKQIVDNNYHITIPVSILFNKKWFYSGAGINIGYRVARKQVFNDGKTIWNNAYYDNPFINWHKEKIIYGIQFKTGATYPINKSFGLRCELYVNTTIIRSAYLNYGIKLIFFSKMTQIKKHE